MLNNITKDKIGRIRMEWKYATDENEPQKQVFTAEEVFMVVKRITEEEAEIMGKECNHPE